MKQQQKHKLGSEIEMVVCIQKSIPEPNEFIKRKLSSQCATIFNRYQMDLTYQHQQLGSDVFKLFQEIQSYSQIVENLLSDYKPCQKLGFVTKCVNQSFKSIFYFLKTFLQQRKDYTEERLKQLEQKIQVQIPGHCNRCRKFILTKDIEQTKVLIGVGQFNDPYNVFQAGGSDFVNIRNKQQDSQYKLKYAEVWQNKKKIQEKFHSMQVQFDKRSYGYTYSAGQMHRFQQTVRDIINQASSHEKPTFTEKQFQDNMWKLVNRIYQKMRGYRDPEMYRNEAVQVGTNQEANLVDQLKLSNQKLAKKNKEIHKKLISRQKQISQLTNKLSKLNEEVSRCTFQINSNEQVMRNLVNQRVQDQTKIYNADYQIRALTTRNQELANENDQIKHQLRKLQMALQFKGNLTKPINKIYKSQKSIKSKVDVLDQQKNVKNQRENNSFLYQHQKSQVVTENKRASIIKSTQKRSVSQLSSISREKQKQKTKGKSKDKVRQSQKQTLQKQQYGQQINNYLSSKDNLGVSFSRKKIKRLTQIRQQSSLSVGRQGNEEFNKNEPGSSLSIQMKEQQTKSLYRSEQRQAMSFKKIKSAIKSLRKIQSKPSIKNEKQIYKINQIQNQLQKKQLVSLEPITTEKQEESCNFTQQQLLNKQIKNIKKQKKRKNSSISQTKKRQNAKKADRVQKKMPVSQHQQISIERQKIIKQRQDQQQKSKKFYSVHNNKKSRQSVKKVIILQNKQIKKSFNPTPSTSFNNSIVTNGNTNFTKKNKILFRQTVMQSQNNLDRIKPESKDIKSNLPLILNYKKQNSAQDSPVANNVKISIELAYSQLYKYYKKLLLGALKKEKNSHFLKYNQTQIQNQISKLSISLVNFQQKIEQYIQSLLIQNKDKIRWKQSQFGPKIQLQNRYIIENAQSKIEMLNPCEYLASKNDTKQSRKQQIKKIKASIFNISTENFKNLQKESRFVKLENSKLVQICIKISKLYFSQQQAYLAQKSNFILQSNPNSITATLNSSFHLNKNQNTDFITGNALRTHFNSVNSSFRQGDSILSQTSEGSKTMSTSFSKFPFNKQNNSSVLSKNQINYLNQTTILLAKLHNKDERLYKMIKKSLIFPYSTLNSKRSSIVDKSNVDQILNSQCQQLGRKTVGGHEHKINNFGLHHNIFGLNSQHMLRQAIVRLVVMHRRCGVVVTSSNYRWQTKCSQINPVGKAPKKATSCLCAHLCQLLQILQSQINEKDSPSPSPGVPCSYTPQGQLQDIDQKQNIQCRQTWRKEKQTVPPDVVRDDYNNDVSPWADVAVV